MLKFVNRSPIKFIGKFYVNLNSTKVGQFDSYYTLLDVYFIYLL
jgi:hypothetical protein